MRIIKNPEPFASSYLPPRVVHRERELEELRNAISEGLKIGWPGVTVVGRSGTGKTTLVKMYLREVPGIYVSCLFNPREGEVLKTAIRRVDAHISLRGLSREKMLSVFAGLLERYDINVLVLDEVQGLRDKDLIYRLTRMEEHCGRGVALVLISPYPVYLSLPSHVVAALGRFTEIRMRPYTREQLMDILRDRASEALYAGAWDDEVMEEIARVAAETGDARLAIEILAKAASLAEREGEARITREHVMRVVAKVGAAVSASMLAGLEDDELIILLALLRIMRRKSEARFVEILDVYNVVCEEIGHRKSARSTVHRKLDDMVRKGLLGAERDASGGRFYYAHLATPEEGEEVILAILSSRVKERYK